MGATVTCNKKIAAIKTRLGEILYFAFEETYEKNVYPHTPKWSCYAFGSHADVMKFVFLAASSCEGGCLQTRSGHTTPENYLKSWARAFQEPVSFSDISISLKLSDSSTSVLPKDRWIDVKEKLENIQRLDIVRTLEEGETYSRNLLDNPSVFLALFGTKGPLTPWRAFNIHDCHTLANREFVPTRTCGAYTAPKRIFMRSGPQQDNLLELIDNRWTKVGWDYNVVGSFINNTAYQAEMTETGSSFDLISAFRLQLRNAAVIPEDTLITLAMDAGDKYAIEDAHNFVQKLGIDVSGVSSKFELSKVPFTERHRLFYFGDEQISFEINNQAYLTPTISQPIIQSALAF